jgi:hypothetical protein
MRSSFLVAAFSLSLAGTALAQSTTGPSAEDVKKAGDEFDQGKRSYKSKNWVEAAEHFEAADSLAPSAVALEWAMKARDKADQLDRAATLASLVLVRHPDRGDLVKTAESLVKRARKNLGEVKVRCEPACGLVVGTKLVPGGAVSERVLFLPSGAAEVRASWSGGRSKSAPVQAAKGSSVEINFTAPPEEKAGASEPTPGAAAGTGSAAEPKGTGGNTSGGSSSGSSVKQDIKTDPGSGLPPVVFWIGTGLTVAAGGVTVWSGLDTQENPGADAVREECVGQGEECSLYQDGLDRQRRTNILLGVTGGLALTTIVIGAFFTNWSGGGKDKASDSARVEPFVGIGSLGARGSF